MNFFSFVLVGFIITAVLVFFWDQGENYWRLKREAAHEEVIERLIKDLNTVEMSSDHKNFIIEMCDEAITQYREITEKIKEEEEED